MFKVHSIKPYWKKDFFKTQQKVFYAWLLRKSVESRLTDALVLPVLHTEKLLIILTLDPS